METIVSAKTGGYKSKRKTAKPQKLSEIKKEKLERFSTGIGEFDRVLGGGVVRGGVVLVAGEPGIGKSTLLLQVAGKLENSLPVLYISGEESLAQVKMRAERLGIRKKNLFLLAETNVEVIGEEVDRLVRAQVQSKDSSPLVIIDSIQSLFTSDLSGTPGSIGQVRECASRLHRLAKNKNLPLFLIGHVTKSGVIAGPKVLEHLVDTVLYLEGERFQIFRLLRALKNRFGPTDEVGVFRLEKEGMVEVSNPSEVFLSQGGERPGSVVVVTMKGNRPILAEVQALVVKSFLAVPRRVPLGIAQKRLLLLCAVLQKNLGLPLGTSDVYLNVAGGLKVLEPGVDLGVCLAIVSSLKNKALGKVAVFGEVGLLGEIRPVGFWEKRVREAKKMGFSQVISGQEFSHLKEVISSVF